MGLSWSKHRNTWVLSLSCMFRKSSTQCFIQPHIHIPKPRNTVANLCQCSKKSWSTCQSQGSLSFRKKLNSDSTRSSESKLRGTSSFASVKSNERWYPLTASFTSTRVWIDLFTSDYRQGCFSWWDLQFQGVSPVSSVMSRVFCPSTERRFVHTMKWETQSFIH